MGKLGLLSVCTAIVGALTLATFSSSASADKPCVTKDPKTEMVREGCKKGQDAVKDAMKKFNKDKGIKSCNKCHKKLAPNYELKDDALDEFKKLGGK
jgi:hypothetical protein